MGMEKRSDAIKFSLGIIGLFIFLILFALFYQKFFV